MIPCFWIAFPVWTCNFNYLPLTGCVNLVAGIGCKTGNQCLEPVRFHTATSVGVINLDGGNETANDWTLSATASAEGFTDRNYSGAALCVSTAIAGIVAYVPS